MVREETLPPDLALPPLDARRAPCTCANAWPAPDTFYWGRRPCPAKPAHAPRTGPALAPPTRLGTGVAKQDLGCCFIRTSWKNSGRGGRGPTVTCHLTPSRSLEHTLLPCKHLRHLLQADTARGRAGDSSGRVVPGLSLGTVSHTLGAKRGLVQGIRGAAWAPQLPWGEKPPEEGPLQKRRRFRPLSRWGPSWSWGMPFSASPWAFGPWEGAGVGSACYTPRTQVTVLSPWL